MYLALCYLRAFIRAPIWHGFGTVLAASVTWSVTWAGWCAPVRVQDTPQNGRLVLPLHPTLATLHNNDVRAALMRHADTSHSGPNGQ